MPRAAPRSSPSAGWTLLSGLAAVLAVACSTILIGAGVGYWLGGAKGAAIGIGVGFCVGVVLDVATVVRSG